MKPHPNNACSGRYDDWLEVNLLPECNGSCSWCIEHGGYHPSERASWQRIVEVAVETGKTNVILLGGEPTIYPDLGNVVQGLHRAGRRVYLTTNGSMLSERFVRDELGGVSGVNISVHDSDLDRNRGITGIDLNHASLREAADALHDIGASIRLNCNCIRGHVDDRDEVDRYIRFAKSIGVDSVRLAELKGNGNGFVDLVDVFGEEYGLSPDPFSGGCSVDVTILGFPVNMRTMCGLQTTHREAPVDPEQILHGVLYYDGNLYDGWQREGTEMTPETRKAMADVLGRLDNGIITFEEAKGEMEKVIDESMVSAGQAGVAKPSPHSGGGCAY